MLEVNEAQRRALSVLLGLIEEGADRMEDGLGDSGRRLSRRMRNDLTAQEREALRVLCGRLRSAVGRVHMTLQPDIVEQSLRAAIRGEAAILWAAVEDSKSPRLAGYGPLSAQAATTVDGILADLSTLLLSVVRLLAGSRDGPAATGDR